MKYTCRLCHTNEDLRQLIVLDNFPSAAQQMPSAAEVAEDAAVSLKIVQCAACGLVQTENNPVHYYKDVITAASYTDESKTIIKSEIKNILNKYDVQPTTALEIGSAAGDYLEILTEIGFRVEGVEHSHENVKQIREKNLAVHQGYLLDGLSLPQKYAFIAINNFLEHQPDIKTFLNRLVALLEDDGLLYISVPNLDRIIERHCLYEFVTDHLVYFTRSTLQTALAMAGFEIVEIYTKNNDNDLVSIVRKPRMIDLQQSNAHVDKIISTLQTYVSHLTNQNKRVCVWGAGHRALALMAISKLDAIHAIIDSAPFKQGRLSPILHKEIISPDAFIEGQFEAIIIMLPGNYGAQAKAYLKKHNFDGEIMIFEDQEITFSGE